MPPAEPSLHSPCTGGDTCSIRDSRYEPEPPPQTVSCGRKASPLVLILHSPAGVTLSRLPSQCLQLVKPWAFPCPHFLVILTSWVLRNQCKRLPISDTAVANLVTAHKSTEKTYPAGYTTRRIRSYPEKNWTLVRRKICLPQKENV